MRPSVGGREMGFNGKKEVVTVDALEVSRVSWTRSEYPSLKRLRPGEEGAKKKESGELTRRYSRTPKENRKGVQGLKADQNGQKNPHGSPPQGYHLKIYENLPLEDNQKVLYKKPTKLYTPPLSM